jgi:hypothetical protein
LPTPERTSSAHAATNGPATEVPSVEATITTFGPSEDNEVRWLVRFP